MGLVEPTDCRQECVTAAAFRTERGCLLAFDRSLSNHSLDRLTAAVGLASPWQVTNVNFDETAESAACRKNNRSSSCLPQSGPAVPATVYDVSLRSTAIGKGRIHGTTRVEEVAGVGDSHHGAGVLEQEAFEPGQAFGANPCRKSRFVALASYEATIRQPATALFLGISESGQSESLAISESRAVRKASCKAGWPVRPSMQ